MNFSELAVGTIKEKLTDPQATQLYDGKLLSVKLRSQVFPFEDKKIQDSPLRVATSNQLMETSGKSVFWLQTGGLLETDIDFANDFKLSGSPVALGFSAKAFVDYQSFRPYILSGPETITNIAKETVVGLPLRAEDAASLLPGTSFQIIGKGTANFSGTFILQKTLSSLSLETAVASEGEFSLRVLREENNTISVTVSLLKKRSLSIMFKGSTGFNVDKISKTILEHDWYKKGQDSLDALETSKISGVIEGWEDGQKLINFFDNDNLEKTLGQYLKNYSSFYFALGTKTSYEMQHLVKYTIDLSQKVGRDAYDALCSLNEEEAEKAWRANKRAVERIEFQSNKTIEQASVELGFPGKKLIMANTLRAIRDGYLLYDNHMKVMRLETAGKEKKVFNTSEEIQWEGLQVQLDNRDTGMDYWRLLYSRYDAVTSKKEIVQFNRFAAAIGIKAYEESMIEEHSFLERIFSEVDNASFQADLFITEDGIKKIKNSASTEVRKIFLGVAAALGKIPAGLPIHNQDVRAILWKYDPNYLRSDSYDDTREMESLRDTYYALPVLCNTNRRNIALDARIYQAAEKFKKECIDSLAKCDESEWGGIFANFGAKHTKDFKQVMATLVLLANLDNVLIAKIEIKRVQSGKILVQAKDSDEIKTGDEIFSEAQQQAMMAM